MDWQYQLISLYLEICNQYEQKSAPPRRIAPLASNTQRDIADYLGCEDISHLFRLLKNEF